MRCLALLLTVAVTGMSAPAAPAAPGRPGAVALSRPAADNPALRGASAPVRGVVPGVTGPAALGVSGASTDQVRRHVAARKSAAATLHDAWGIFFNDSAAQGLQATHSVLPGVTTSGGDYLYAPTALPPGGACIEMTTAYTPEGPKLWGWDWCGGRDTIGKVVDMNASFLATYTTTVNGRPSYTMEERKTSTTANAWTVYLYNYQTHAFDTFLSSTGNKDIPGSSWDFFEMYTTVNPATGAGYYCTDAAGMSLEASGVKVSQGGAWTPANASNSSLANPPAGSVFDCPSLKLSIVHANDDWLAQFGGGGNPPPAGTSYEAEASGNTLAGQAAARSSAGASGGTLVGYVGNGAANYLQFNNVRASAAGIRQVTVHFASAENRSMTVSVGGGPPTTVNTPGTGGWDTVGSVTVPLQLTAGTNTIRFGNPTGWAPDLDRIVVS